MDRTELVYAGSRDPAIMGPRFFTGLTAADVVTLANAVIGFAAIVVASTDPELAARLILLAAVADGVDGVLARAFGGSEVGPYLDSLADVPSFALAPAVVVYVTLDGAPVPLIPETYAPAILVAIAGVFVSAAVLRLGFYSAYDTAATKTVGAPTTLAATILSVAVLTAYGTEPVLAAGTVLLAGAMVAPIDYPDLLARDAVLMGVIHVLAVAFPTAYGRVFPYALLTLALAYLLLAPSLYWGESERRLREPAPAKGKQS